MTINLDELTPPHIVAELDKYIIGQTKAKKPLPLPCETGHAGLN